MSSLPKRGQLNSHRAGKSKHRIPNSMGRDIILWVGGITLAAFAVEPIFKFLAETIFRTFEGSPIISKEREH